VELSGYPLRMYSTLMNRDADNLADARPIAQWSHRLRERGPHADVTSLEEAAVELWLA
jgi:hypothetical protein